MLSDNLEKIKEDLASLAAAGQYCSLFASQGEDDLDKDVLCKELELIAESAGNLAEHAGNYLLTEECRKRKESPRLSGEIFQSGDTVRIYVKGRIRKRKQSNRAQSPGAGYESYNAAVFDLITELCSKECKRYREKVRISFIQHYALNTPVLDADNMEVKPYIDAICIYLLDDDSIEQCCLSLDGVIDGDDWLEIVVQPVNRHF